MFKKLCIVTLMVASLNYVQAVSLDKDVVELTIPIEEHQAIELPEDVLMLLERSKECAKWIDLWDSSLEKAHKDKIEANVNSICLAIIEERTQLMDKYKDHPEILEHLQ